MWDHPPWLSGTLIVQLSDLAPLSISIDVMIIEVSFNKGGPNVSVMGLGSGSS